MSFYCVPSNLWELIGCTFSHAFGYNPLIMGIVLLGFFGWFMYKTNLPLSVSLPGIFALSLALFTVYPGEFRLPLYLAAAVGSGLIAYAFFKIKK